MDRFSSIDIHADVLADIALASEYADYSAITAEESALCNPAPWSAAWLDRHLADMREAAEIDALKESYLYTGSSGLSVRSLDRRDASIDRDLLAESLDAGPQGYARVPSDAPIPGNDEEPLGESVCLSGYNAVLNASTLREAAEAMRAHYVSCAICGSDRRVVVGDRVDLGKRDAVCCEGKAA